ncbi:hypothetical protein GWN26_16265, partial [Candidatus Saccharibacteria bacterium]|nr:hypothetical protein [Candidatus Saccharibacteria bacterium]NIW80945.1 hypothetical protein [Calditrichia bacterium]
HGTGRRELVAPMSLAALAAGAAGLIIEVHSRPDQSVTDPFQTLGIEQFSQLMFQINQFSEWRKTYADAPHAN